MSSQTLDHGPAAHAEPVGVGSLSVTVENADAVDGAVGGGTLLALDGNSLVHRAFHANARMGFSLRDGRSAWAVRGLLGQLAAAVDRSCADAVLVGFDDPAHSERRTRWPQYKAQRVDKLPGLCEQLQLAAEVLYDLGVAVCTPPGLEADDVLASAARYARKHGWRCVVATSDRDAFALVDDNTRVLRILNGGVEASPMLTPDRLRLVTGVHPHQYRDLAALRGDPSDNLPGVRGVGPRKATQLLTTFGTAEQLFTAARDSAEQVRSVVGPRLAERLAEPASEQAWRFNREVMTMRHDIPLPTGLLAEVGRLPLAEAAITKVFTAFDLFLPNGLRALAGIEAPTPAARDLDPNWQPPSGRPPTTGRGSTRFPPLPKPKPNPFRQDTLF